jgi:hypothetical protein
MTYVLCDANGFVGDLASITGLDDMQKALKGDPVLDEFFEFGYYDDIETLKKALADKKSTDPMVNATIENLRQLAAQCEIGAIIWDGVSYGEG